MEIINNQKHGPYSRCHGNGVVNIPAQVISAVRTNSRHASLLFCFLSSLLFFLTGVKGIREECNKSILFSSWTLSQRERRVRRFSLMLRQPGNRRSGAQFVHTCSRKRKTRFPPSNARKKKQKEGISMLLIVLTAHRYLELLKHLT